MRVHDSPWWLPTFPAQGGELSVDRIVSIVDGIVLIVAVPEQPAEVPESFCSAAELLYHRRRVSLREEIIHATQHIAEDMMWTALDALRFLTRR